MCTPRCEIFSSGKALALSFSNPDLQNVPCLTGFFVWGSKLQSNINYKILFVNLWGLCVCSVSEIKNLEGIPLKVVCKHRASMRQGRSVRISVRDGGVNYFQEVYLGFSGSEKLQTIKYWRFVAFFGILLLKQRFDINESP